MPHAGHPRALPHVRQRHHLVGVQGEPREQMTGSRARTRAFIGIERVRLIGWAMKHVSLNRTGNNVLRQYHQIAQGGSSKRQTTAV